MQTDDDLPALILRKDHYNVLCYLRVHQLRDPALVLEHAHALLGKDLAKRPPFLKELGRLAILEQTCLAAMDAGDSPHAESLATTSTTTSDNIALASLCMKRLEEGGVSKDSLRLRHLKARLLEASGDLIGAQIFYDELMKENPANLMAFKRSYCLLKAQPGKQQEAMDCLSTYLQKCNLSDTAAWYEMAQARMEMGDYASAAHCLEETLLANPSNAHLHVQLAEVYASISSNNNHANLENLILARKHMAQALELEPDNRRAQMGLVMVANSYLLEIEAASKKQKFQVDEHQVLVAKELVKYGAEAVLHSYKGSDLQAATRSLMNDYVDNL